MWAYRFVIFLAVILLVGGVGYAAFSNGTAPADRARLNPEAVQSEQEVATRLAAEQGLEFVPAERRNDEVLLTGNTIVINESIDSPVIRGNQGRGVTVEAGQAGGPAKIVYEAEKKRSGGKFRITSINDLLRLTEKDVREMEEGNVDVDIYQLRDDVNFGLMGLGKTIRTLNQTYAIPGVSGRTSFTGNVEWAPDEGVERSRRQKARAQREKVRRGVVRLD